MANLINKERIFGDDSLRNELKDIMQLFEGINQKVTDVALNAEKIKNAFGGKMPFKDVVKNAEELALAEKNLANSGKELASIQNRINDSLRISSKEAKSAASSAKAFVEAQNAEISAAQKIIKNNRQSTIVRKALNKEVRDSKATTMQLAIAMQAEKDSVTQLSAVNKALEIRMKSLDVTTKEGEASFARLASAQLRNTKVMQKQMTDMRLASKGFNGLQFQVQQLARELPALAYGPQMFIAAISNNFPMLVDEINRVKQANIGLEKSMQKSVGKEILKSIFSWQSAIVVIITAYMMFSKQINEFIGNMFRHNRVIDSAKALQKSLKNAINEGTKSAIDQTVELKALYSITQDNNRSMTDRLNAIDKLQSQYPDYLGNIDRESFLVGGAAENYKLLTKAITEHAIAEAKLNEVKKIANEIWDLEKKNTDQVVLQYNNARKELSNYDDERSKLIRSFGGEGVDVDKTVLLKIVDTYEKRLQNIADKYEQIDRIVKTMNSGDLTFDLNSKSDKVSSKLSDFINEQKQRNEIEVNNAIKTNQETLKKYREKLEKESLSKEEKEAKIAHLEGQMNEQIIALKLRQENTLLGSFEEMYKKYVNDKIDKENEANQKILDNNLNNIRQQISLKETQIAKSDNYLEKLSLQNDLSQLKRKETLATQDIELNNLRVKKQKDLKSQLDDEKLTNDQRLDIMVEISNLQKEMSETVNKNYTDDLEHQKAIIKEQLELLKQQSETRQKDAKTQRDMEYGEYSKAIENQYLLKQQREIELLKLEHNNNQANYEEQIKDAEAQLEKRKELYGEDKKAIADAENEISDLKNKKAVENAEFEQKLNEKTNKLRIDQILYESETGLLRDQISQQNALMDTLVSKKRWSAKKIKEITEKANKDELESSIKAIATRIGLENQLVKNTNGTYTAPTKEQFVSSAMTSGLAPNADEAEKQYQALLDAMHSYNVQVINGKLELLDNEKEYWSAVQEIANQYFQWQQAMYEAQLADAERLYKAQTEAAGTSSEKKIQAEKEYEQEQRKIKKKQAIAQKLQSVFNATMVLAEAIASADALKIITATSGLAFAIATPIPKFAEGVENFEGGEAILGDGYEKELVREPSGKMWWSSDKPTLYDLPKGTDVIPSSDIQNDLANYAMMQTYDVLDMSQTNKRLDKLIENTGNKETISVDSNGNKVIKRGYITTTIR